VFSGISEAADGDVALVAFSFWIKSAQLKAIGVKDIARRPQDRGEEIGFTRDGLFGWQPRRDSNPNNLIHGLTTQVTLSLTSRFGNGPVRNLWRRGRDRIRE
jgi:hypothetical protein